MTDHEQAICIIPSATGRKVECTRPIHHPGAHAPKKVQS